MGLFKSAEEKRVEEKMLVRRAIGKIQTYIDRLAEAKKHYIEEAKLAKNQGIISQYNLARSALGMLSAQSHVAEQLLLTMQMSEQMKSSASITQDFADGMGTLSREINKINDTINIARVNKKMQTAMTGTENRNGDMQDFLAESNMMFGDQVNKATRDTLDEMINREVKADNNENLSGMDAEIAEMLKKSKGN